MFFIKRILGYRKARAERLRREIDDIKNYLEEARGLMSRSETKAESCRRARLAKRIKSLAKSEGIPLKKIGTDAGEIFRLEHY